jgi:uroporphyrinogen III methyltransferase/synthase
LTPVATLALQGRRILVTRRTEQAVSLVSPLRAAGAIVIELPTVEVAPPSDPAPLEAALHSLQDFDWVVFTSPNAIRAFRDATARLAIDVAWNPDEGGAPVPSTQAPKGRPRLASVGATTTQVLRETWPQNVSILQPATEYRAAALLSEFARHDIKARRILLPVSSMARDELAAGLEAQGARVEQVEAYRTITPERFGERIRQVLDDGFDLVLFASPSAVAGFASTAPERMAGLPAAVIGPTTREAAVRAGFAVVAEAEPATAEGLVRAVRTLFLPQIP